MIRIAKTFAFAIVLSSLLLSCDTQPSLQSYYVDNQESPNFLTVEIPPSILSLDETSLTDSQKKAYNSIKRLSFLGYKLDEKNKANYTAELANVKQILSNEKYEDLIEVNSPDFGKITGKSLGNGDTVDEFVLLVSNKDTGFGVIRVLGDDMSPTDLASLVNAMQNANFDSSKFESIMNFYK
ncbi:MAG: DUF4252 domain-containing protein [Flavobacteriaceae bacterium]|nr:DUF4252 domain-containing protein [Mangrovimonas sp.]MCB0469964.1 DUF4252 domain-containing protein [Flavobacteriaceae bacterium]MCB0426313.1 DUF4252 domain-containing protein [Mangrovimonas sp.]MCB0434035.1 DUF4252 domain-containing protein [Mangrovimonas sp.]MCB0434746.1 DUF4252 domain-containing protein [Mangrovimonas sp.]